jgi:hypothetical protein
MAENPPTAKQIGLLKKLAVEKQQTFVEPQTSRQASEEIKRLMNLKTPPGYRAGRRTSRAGTARTKGRNVG